MVAKIIESNLEVGLISGKEWTTLTRERKIEYLKRYIHMAELKSNRRITYAEIADEIGITKQAISAYCTKGKTGHTNIQFPMYYAMTHALDEINLK